MAENAAENQEWRLISVPHGLPKQSDFELVAAPLPNLEEGQVLLKTLFVSVDPYIRGRLVKPGPVSSEKISEVIESRNADIAVGAVVIHRAPWSSFNVSGGKGLRVLKTGAVPTSYFLGTLGMTGFTAYTGLLHAAQLKEGDTVVVNAAAGAVGHVVGQIAKAKGCRVVGTCGTQEKAEWLKELGFDVALNYKEHSSFETMTAALKKACPDGIDVFFENTGAHVSSAVCHLLNRHARIAVCGQIARYNDPEWSTKSDGGSLMIDLNIPLRDVIYKGINIRGFVQSEYRQPAMIKSFEDDMAQWFKEGHLKTREVIVNGLDKIPDAFISLFSSKNIGKVIVKL